VFIFSMTVNSRAQVNMQSGSAEQSFPLINYVDGKAGLTTGIGLAYSSGNGLLVNDIASDVGTGWNLDAGGIIVRVQNGEPDDQPQWTNNKFWEYMDQNPEYVYKNYPNGYMYNSHVGEGCNVGLNYYPVFKHQALYKELNVVASDMEQDKFIFRMNGRSGIFVIGKDWKVTTVGDSRIKISFSTADLTSQGIRTTINQFIITTEDGIKYTFSDKSLSTICRYKYSYRDGNGNWQVINGNPDDGAYAVNRFWGYKLNMDERPYVVNSWFLSEIENTNTKQKINFNYQNVTNDITAAKLVSHQRDLNNSGPVRWCCTNADRIRNGRAWYSYLSNPVNGNNFSWNTDYLDKLKASSTSILYNRSAIQSKRLSSITLPNGGLINFTYSYLERTDLPGENAMEKISYNINGKLIREYKLSYGYFFKRAVYPYSYKFGSFESKFTRLCLISVQKQGTGEDNATEPPYTFSYYLGSTRKGDDIVPARNYLSQDHWGYYNGYNSGLSLLEDHDFLSYEQSEYFKTVLAKYKNAKYGYAKNGLLKSVTYPTGGTIEYVYDQNVASKNILPAGNAQLAGGVSVTQTIVSDGETHAKDIIKEYNYKNSSNISTRWGDESPNYYSFGITEYNEKWFNKKFKYPGMLYPEMSTSVDWGKILGKALVGAAINIGVSVAMQAILAGTAALPIINIVVFVVTVVKMIFDATKTYEYHRYILSNQNNMQSNPLLPYYSSVEVRSNSPTGYNGKTVYSFTSDVDYPALVPKLEWPYIQNQRLASWVYGLPKKVIVYDANNTILNESESIYQYIVSKTADQNNQSCKCATENKRSYNAYGWDEYDKTNFTWNQEHWMIPRPYYIYTGRTDNTSSSDKAYTSNGSLYYSTVSNVITDPMTLLQKGKIVQKDVNSLIIQLTYFPTDYSIAGSAMERLKTINAIHTPVSTETWLLKVGPGSTYSLEMLNAVVTEYKTFTFGNRQEVKPWKTYQLKSKTPVSYTVIGMHNPNQLLRQPQLFKQGSEMIYDNDGNLIQTISDENVTSFANDYSDRYVVASASNAAATEIAYSSFESNGKGNWIFNSAGINQTEGLTGNKSFSLGGNYSISCSGLNTAKEYLITYWVKDVSGAIVSVNGQLGTLLFQTGAWKLYTQTITNSSNVNITGTATIDELRLYPKGSLMSTVAYKEGIGKIADCDANNRLLFYEYDALGRLRLVKDQNRNIIKTYEYNYKK
jgi:hypothetical protein